MRPGDEPAFRRGLHNPARDLNDLARLVAQHEGQRPAGAFQLPAVPGGSAVFDPDPGTVLMRLDARAEPQSAADPAEPNKWSWTEMMARADGQVVVRPDGMKGGTRDYYAVPVAPDSGAPGALGIGRPLGDYWEWVPAGVGAAGRASIGGTTFGGFTSGAFTTTLWEDGNPTLTRWSPRSNPPLADFFPPGLYQFCIQFNRYETAPPAGVAHQEGAFHVVAPDGGALGPPDVAVYGPGNPSFTLYRNDAASGSQTYYATPTVLHLVDAAVEFRVRWLLFTDATVVFNGAVSWVRFP